PASSISIVSPISTTGTPCFDLPSAHCAGITRPPSAGDYCRGWGGFLLFKSEAVARLPRPAEGLPSRGSELYGVAEMGLALREDPRVDPAPPRMEFFGDSDEFSVDEGALDGLAGVRV